MKRLLVCICAGLAFIQPQQLQAQLSIPSTYSTSIHQGCVRSLAENYIGLENISQQPVFTLNAEQKEYLKVLSTYLDTPNLLIQDSDKLISKLSHTIDRSRAELLLALAYYDKKENEKALALLSGLNLPSLYNYEQEQAQLLRAYLLLNNKKGIGQLRDIRQVLSVLMKSPSLHGEQASLYMSSILWYEGKSEEAHKLLEQRRWSKSILPEVAYQDALLSYSLDNPQTAIANSQRLFSLHPEMKQRPRLLGAMAYAYYSLGDYYNAQNTLATITGQESMLPFEFYVLGVSLYAEKKYNEAIPALQQASMTEGELKALAQFALGNIYQYQGDIRKSQFAFESTINTTADKNLKEQAIYRFLEVSHSGGQDVFGNHAQIAQDFVISYPSSPYKERVLELLRTYISGSSNYAATLKLLNSLEQQGLKLQELRQEVLLRQAINQKTQQQDYLPTLASAIQLGYMGNSTFSKALVLRAEALLRNKRYQQAEADAVKALENAQGLNKNEIAEIEYLLGYARYNQKKYMVAIPAFVTANSQLDEKDKRGDALLRLADSYLVLNKYSDAIESYQKAHNTIPHGSDEALFRLATIYGKQRQYSKQIQVIDDALRSYPLSDYSAQLLYNKGRAQRLIQQTDKALLSFDELINKYPYSDVAPTARLEQALIYSNQGDDEQAIRSYKELITLYPQTREAETALADLKALYIEQGNTDEYLAYTQTLSGKLRPNSQDEAHLRYLSIEDKVRRGLSGSTEALEEYIKAYPKSPDLLSAQQLLANRYASEGRVLDAIRLLQTIYADNAIQGEDKLKTGLQLAELQQKQGQNDEAYTSYLSIYKEAQGTKLYRIRAGLGLLRSRSNSTKNNTEALAIANQILLSKDLTMLERQEIILIKGGLEEHNKSFNQAIETYSSLNEAYNSKYGAEAIIRQADILMRLKKYNECQEVLNKFIASGSSQTYWLARAFVLLSDSYDKQGDVYLAKQYIESLRDNYSGNETDIQEMINVRLNKYSK